MTFEAYFTSISLLIIATSLFVSPHSIQQSCMLDSFFLIQYPILCRTRPVETTTPHSLSLWDTLEKLLEVERLLTMSCPLSPSKSRWYRSFWILMRIEAGHQHTTCAHSFAVGLWIHFSGILVCKDELLMDPGCHFCQILLCSDQLSSFRASPHTLRCDGE